MTRLLASTAAILLAISAHPALADAPTADVRYGDLDLSTREGRATLDRRIDAAARNLCSVGASRDLRQAMASQRCYRVALDSTRTQLAAAITKKRRAAI